MKIRERYKLNKELVVGDKCICPSCGICFVKSNYQQAFCKTQKGTVCKDAYWNLVTPTKRNNTTRISPASARWMSSKRSLVDSSYDPDDEHPFSSDALGQE